MGSSTDVWPVVQKDLVEKLKELSEPKPSSAANALTEPEHNKTSNLEVDDQTLRRFLGTGRLGEVSFLTWCI